MRRIIAVVIFVLCTTAAAGLEIPTKAGTLNLPLRVTESARVDRRAGPVTGGVPLPLGLVRDLSKLRVVDPQGRVVPAQFAVMERWWRPAYDNSVRWLKVDFQADVPATETAVYYLRDDSKGAPPDTPLRVTEDAEAITVVAGRLKFIVSKTAFNVIDRAWLDLDQDGAFADGERMIDSSPDNGGVITSGAWPANGLADNTTFYSSARAPKSRR